MPTRKFLSIIELDLGGLKLGQREIKAFLLTVSWTCSKAFKRFVILKFFQICANTLRTTAVWQSALTDSIVLSASNLKIEHANVFTVTLKFKLLKVMPVISDTDLAFIDGSGWALSKNFLS